MVMDGACGEGCSSQARAFEIFGAGARESERLEPLGESKPASVDDRFSGVEASIAEGVGDAPGNWRWRGKRRRKVGAGRAVGSLPVIRLSRDCAQCTTDSGLLVCRGRGLGLLLRGLLFGRLVCF